LYDYQKGVGQNYGDTIDEISINYKKSTPHQVGKAYVQKVILNKEAEHYEE